MDFSLSAIVMTVVLLLWALGRVVLRFIPNIPIIFDTIEHGKKVLNFIGEAPKWINYSKNLEQSVESLNEEMQTLLSVEADIRQEVQRLEFRNNETMRAELVNWLGNVARRKQEVEILVQHVEQTGAVSRFLYRAWLGSCVENKKKELRLLKAIINANRVGRERLVTSELVGRVAAEKVEEIWGSLISQGVTVLGVKGDRGMGKTATMKHINNRIVDNIPSSFDNAFYVSVQEGDDVPQLQSAIGSLLKLQDLEDEDDVIRRAAKIYRALMSKGRFVLIFDGLMLPFELHSVGIPRFEKCGGKLVVVAHALSQRVCQRMLCRPIIRVKALPPGEAKELLKYTLSPTDDLSQAVKFVSDELIRGCNYVPRRIIEAAESLRNVDDITKWIFEWRRGLAGGM